MDAHDKALEGGPWSAPMTSQSPQPGAPSVMWQFDPRRHARSLYWRGWGVTQIAEEFALHSIVNDKGGPIPRATIEAWKQRDRWDDAPSIRKIEDGLEIRLLTLIAKDKKTGGDYVEMDALSRQIESLAKVRRYSEPGGGSDLVDDAERLLSLLRGAALGPRGVRQQQRRLRGGSARSER